MAEQSDKLSASGQGNLPEVRCLLQNADVNDAIDCNRFGRTPLQEVKQGNTAVAIALLEAGADPNTSDPSTGLTIMHEAARGGCIDLVRVLIQKEADVNLLDIHGNLPLHLAAREGHHEVVGLLMEHTTNPALPNTQGCTSLFLGVKADAEKYRKCMPKHRPNNN